MKSFQIIQVVPKSNDVLLETHRREGVARLEADVGVIWPQATEGKECLEPPEAGRLEKEILFLGH